MDGNDVQRLESIVRDLNSWCQDVFVEQSDETRINLSCYDCDSPSPPEVEAIDQPSFYPKDCVYKFPPEFHGMEGWEPLKQMLTAKRCCPGATFSVCAVDNRQSHSRLMTARIGCSHGRKQDSKQSVHNTSAQSIDDLKGNAHFAAGKASRKDVKKQSVKRKKSAGAKAKGINSMHSKKGKKRLPHAERRTWLLDEDNKVRRTEAARGESGTDLCTAAMHVVLNPFDDGFYLLSKSCFRHIGHPQMEQNAVPLGGKDLSDPERKFLDFLLGTGVSATQAAKIMSELQADEHGQHGSFLPQTIWNVGEKIRNTKDLVMGITHNVTDAERTILRLEA